jgi:single-stranded-DNA-specific exonuclease
VGCNQKQLTAESIGFGLGPRINAAGRLGDAYDAARLLIAGNSQSAQTHAKVLDELNRKRQSLTRQLSARAEQIVDPTAPILIAADAEFKSGVVGLVASRLAEKHYRPAIIMERGEDESRGSCRSIPEFHITDALDEVADLLVPRRPRQATGASGDDAASSSPASATSLPTGWPGRSCDRR